MTIQARLFFSFSFFLFFFLMLPLGILERSNMYYEPSMPITVLNALLSFSHHISSSQSRNWISKVLSKFSRITEIVEPGLKSRTVCFHKLYSFCFPTRFNVTQFNWKKNNGKVYFKILLDIHWMFTIEHLILNAIAQLAHKLLILLKGTEIVDPSQGTQMNIVLAFYQNGRSLIEEMLILIVGENSTISSKFRTSITKY